MIPDRRSRMLEHPFSIAVVLVGAMVGVFLRILEAVV